MPEHLVVQLGVTGGLAVFSWLFLVYVLHADMARWTRYWLVSLAACAGTLTTVGFVLNVVTSMAWLAGYR